MEREEIEYITALIDITVTNTLTKLDLIPERYSASQANKIYGEKMINEWRQNNWITVFSSGNSVRAKLFYLRSECEQARLMAKYITRRDPYGKIVHTMEGNNIRIIIEGIRKGVIESLELKAAKEKEKEKALALKRKAKGYKA